MGILGTTFGIGLGCERKNKFCHRASSSKRGFEKWFQNYARKRQQQKIISKFQICGDFLNFVIMSSAVSPNREYRHGSHLGREIPAFLPNYAPFIKIPSLELSMQKNQNKNIDVRYRRHFLSLPC